MDNKTPWKAEETGVVYHGVLCFKIYDADGELLMPSKEVATLCAAAPDLLAVLSEILCEVPDRSDIKKRAIEIISKAKGL